MPRLGILTSGGDCPGLNAVIRSSFIRLTREHGGSLLGFRNGWLGLLDDETEEITEDVTRGIAGLGGTVLGTSRTTRLRDPDAIDRVQQALQANGLDGLIAIGGEGTLSAAHALSRAGVNVVGVPKTIDNDVNGTDYSFGFDTAVQIATDAMDRLLTTGASHGRCMIAEVMGRNSGWIALHAGVATGAHAVLIPEHPVPIDTVVEWVESARRRGQAPLIVVAEGFPLDDDGVVHPRGVESSGRPRLGGVGERLALLLEERTGIETRAATLGHIQRGGTPTAYDRVLAARLGAAAVDCAVDGDWGKMVALSGENIVRAELVDAIGTVKQISRERYQRAAVCFG